MDASGWMDLVLSRSAELRKAGVLAIGFDGCSAQLAAHVEDYAGDKPQTAPIEGELDSLHDPNSYPGGIVPGFTITRLTEVSE